MKVTVFAMATFAISGSFPMAWDSGSQQEARDIAAQMSSISQTAGLDAGIEAMHDQAKPFATSQLGIHIFENGIIVGDNREPELLASSYEDVEDLTGEPMWPRIAAAADTRSDAMLEWYHYDTEAEYSDACYSEWAVEGTALVKVCRQSLSFGEA